MAVPCTALAGAPALASPPSTGGTPMAKQVPAVPAAVSYGPPGTASLNPGAPATLGHTLNLYGTLPHGARRRVVLQRRDRRHGWVAEASARVRTTSRFHIAWKTDHSGRLRLRVVVARAGARASAAQPAPVADVTVYRPALATFFGPGLFGRQTACGQVLTPQLLGVAHRKLPCGTLVELTYARRVLRVPVVDRGPFAAGYAWDLTQATADALGFTASGAIGYVWYRRDARR